MSEHLTDRQLQQWLEEGAPEEGDVARHLACCRRCSAQAQAYLRLWGDLAVPPAVCLPEDFARRVAAQATPRSTWAARVAALLGLLAYAGIGCLAACYYKLHLFMWAAFAAAWSAAQHLFGSFRHLSLASPFCPQQFVLLAIVAAVLLTVGLLDRLLSRLILK
ncbi:MAG: hypothetical protein QHJ34_09710 [bacterium]|jgi:anti-sigma factor RsiW|nr:hypothetical protein [candidate division KSB1 bacterium]MDH7560493.1 hypothetical protein [bacterium]